MTHLHLSTLGQCLVSLARQGIKEPLYRVLRFVESGAIVPNFQKTVIESDQKGDSNGQKLAKKSSPSSIQTNQVKVSFRKASDILDQISKIQQQPDPVAVIEQPSPKGIVYPPNYSIEEQCQDIQKIVDQVSPIESYLKNQLSQMTDHLEQIKNYHVNEVYLQQVKDEVDFLSMVQNLCQFSYTQLNSQDSISEFTRLLKDIFSNVPDLSNPTGILQLMKQFNFTYFDADRCFQLNKRDLSLSVNCLKRLFFTTPKTFFKIDKMD